MRRVNFICLALVAFELLFTLFSGRFFVISQKIILGVICVICIILGKKERFILNPFYCFFLTPFSLLIYSPVISPRFLTELRSEVYIVAVLSFIAFIVGCNKYSTQSESCNNHSSQRLSTINYDNKFASLGCSFLVVPLLYQLFIAFSSIRLPLAAIMNQFVYIGVAFLLKSNKKKSYILVLALCLFLLLTKFRKTVFLYLFILFLLPILNTGDITNRTKKLGIITIGLGVVFMVFIAYPLKMYFAEYGTLSGLELKADYLRQIVEKASVNYGNLGGSVFMLRPYLSMTTEWTNLDCSLDIEPLRTYGMWFLRPILNILQINTESMPIYSLTPRSNYYNTFGFLTIQIKDFGFVGAVLFTFLLGWFTGWAYRQFREQRNNPLEVVRYLYVSCAVLEMFFSNHFLLGGIHICYLLTWIVFKYLNKSDRQLYDYLKNRKVL